MTILDRLERSKTPETPSGVADRMYESMMAEIRAKAVNDARLAVQAELDAAMSETKAAQAETLRAEAERDAQKSLREASDKIAEELRTKVSQLKKAFELEQLALSNKGAEMDDDKTILQNELKEERIKSKNLEIEVSGLKGKLSVKPPKQIIKPTQVPEFEFEVTEYGTNDRIRKVKATPRLQ